MWQISIILLSVLTMISSHASIMHVPLEPPYSPLHGVIESAIKLIIYSDTEKNSTELITDTVNALSKIELNQNIEYDYLFKAIHSLVEKRSSLDYEIFHLSENINLIRHITKNRSGNDTNPITLIREIRMALRGMKKILRFRYGTDKQIPLLKLLYTRATNPTETRYQFSCQWRMTIQQLFYHLYQMILNSEALGFAKNIDLSFTIPSNVDIRVVKKISSQFLMRTKEYIKYFKKYLNQSPVDYDICDPPNPKRNKTCVELEGAIQKTIIQEITLATDVRNECVETCGYSMYSSESRFLADCERNKESYNGWCPIRPCKGIISNCISGGDLQFGELPYGFSRRYTSIKNKNFVHGTNYSTEVIATRDHSMYKEAYSYVSGFVCCDMCICTCTESDEYSDVIRTISMRPVLSDIQKHKIITGLRFIETGGVIQIQIHESLLLPYGNVSRSAADSGWKEPEHIYRENDKILFRNKTDEKILTSRIDYLSITPSQKFINLDDIIADPSYVVTGVRIGYTSETFSDYTMRLEIHTTKFDFQDGQLSQKPEDSVWRFANNTDEKRSRVEFSKPDNPLNVNAFHNTYSAKNKYVVFDTSDPIVDAGQTTIPLIDTQPVMLHTMQPLSGVGLTHRGTDGSGGYLALKIFTINLGKYWND